MTESNPSSKKWVDYSDDSPDEEDKQENPTTGSPKYSNHQQNNNTHKTSPSKPYSQKMLEQLKELDRRGIDDVWLILSSEDYQYLNEQITKLRRKISKNGDIVAIFPAKEDYKWEVKVFIDLAYEYADYGYDKTGLMKVEVAENNYQNRQYQKNYQQKSKYTSNKDQQKRKYVDKETGKEPSPKRKEDERTNLELQKNYDNQDIRHKEKQLPSFKNKDSWQETNLKSPRVKYEQKVPKQDPKIQKKYELKEKSEIRETKEFVEKIQIPATQAKVVQPVEKDDKTKTKEKQKKKTSEKVKNKSKLNKAKSQNRFEGMQELN